MTNNKKSKQLSIGEVLIDWFTVTAWEDGATNSWAWWHAVASDHGLTKEEDGIGFMQYEGNYWKGGDGSFFLGTGIQKNQVHNMARASGALSHSMFDRAAATPVKNGWARCTRLDIQITLAQPDDWYQWALANRLRKSGANIGYIDSSSGKGGRKLATVYVGSRQSSRVTRIYQKEAGAKSEMYLRFETEFKGHRANIMAKSIADNRVEMGNYLLHEVQQLNDNGLTALFGAALSTYDPNSVKVKRVKSSDSTAHWLMTKCLPTLDRWINDHDHDDEVFLAFGKVLSDKGNRT